MILTESQLKNLTEEEKQEIIEMQKAIYPETYGKLIYGDGINIMNKEHAKHE